jgi:hypothetical protein
MQRKSPKQGSVRNIGKAVLGTEVRHCKQLGKQCKALSQGSASHQGKAVQGTLARQCKAPWQGSARHLVKTMECTEQGSAMH